MAAVSKPSDHLVDVLKQIQARKTVKPEDATKALQQYKRVQDHIKELKAEIEFFKSVIEKEKQVCILVRYLYPLLRFIFKHLLYRRITSKS